VFNYGYIQAEAQLAPDKAAQFYDTLSEITADLKAGRITADELDRARNPAIQNFEKTRQTNEYWLAVLDGAQENSHVLDMARKFQAAVRHVGLSDIAGAARKYLVEPRMIRLTAGS
jgi:zinc protease